MQAAPMARSHARQLVLPQPDSIILAICDRMMAGTMSQKVMSAVRGGLVCGSSRLMHRRSITIAKKPVATTLMLRGMRKALVALARRVIDHPRLTTTIHTP